MKKLMVEILNQNETDGQAAEIPYNAPVKKIIDTLVRKMNLPTHGPGGVNSYILIHKRTGKQLIENQTLAENQVENGDQLRIQAELTAGQKKQPMM